MVTKKNSRNPWAWIPTLYFAEGLPNVIVTVLSVVMYMQLGLTDAEVGLYTGWLALPLGNQTLVEPVHRPAEDEALVGTYDAGAHRSSTGRHCVLAAYGFSVSGHHVLLLPHRASAAPPTTSLPTASI